MVKRLTTTQGKILYYNYDTSRITNERGWKISLYWQEVKEYTKRTLHVDISDTRTFFKGKSKEERKVAVKASKISEKARKGIVDVPVLEKVPRGFVKTDWEEIEDYGYEEAQIVIIEKRVKEKKKKK